MKPHFNGVYYTNSQMIATNQITESTLNSYALEAYVYGFPVLLMNITRRTGLASMMQKNLFYHQQTLSTPEFKLVVRPNVDTLYSPAWLDLTDGPLLLHVPDTNGKYYLLSMLDAYSNVFSSIGSRTTGTSEQYFVIAGPSWHGSLPPNIPVIYAPTNTALIAGRTQTDGPKDYPIVHTIQRGYTLTPLFPSSSKGMLDERINSKQSPKDIVGSMDAAVFFTLLMSLMAKNPPYSAIQSPEITIKLRTLGLMPSSSFNYYDLSPTIQTTLSKAAQVGLQAISAAGDEVFRHNEVNGWSILLNNVGNYGTNYIYRAVAADRLFLGNIPQDAVYGYSFVDNAGHLLDGHNMYRIHFLPEQLPPVHAFWSVTLYNSDGFLVENEINRYALSPHLDNLHFNADGSLDFVIQSTSPGKDNESNWLPAPLGSFNLVIRLYWPQTSVLYGQWLPPSVIKINK
ncbi:hypothetical protein FHS15_000624 [Paenibacillus castaneae]|uniref:DUF1254 domain-containing protein n=1 Tax=Paenibacillus castaneae TaxID=474957 RepID=UPI00141A6F58|nr:DUF1254 domain-containing protein [Paenibacillus castaneae]NIK75524.1 hypothetical protein [Paenibacillus castaneae]